LIRYSVRAWNCRVDNSQGQVGRSIFPAARENVSWKLLCLCQLTEGDFAIGYDSHQVMALVISSSTPIVIRPAHASLSHSYSSVQYSKAFRGEHRLASRPCTLPAVGPATKQRCIWRPNSGLSRCSSRKFYLSNLVLQI